MQINPLKASNFKASVKKAKKSSFPLAVFELDETDSPVINAVNDISVTSSIGNIFNINVLSYQHELNKINYEKGEELLANLDNLFKNIITEDYSSKDIMLKKLETQIADIRQKSPSDELEKILESIELRTAVEIAKIKMSKK